MPEQTVLSLAASNPLLQLHVKPSLFKKVFSFVQEHEFVPFREPGPEQENPGSTLRVDSVPFS